MSDPRTCPSCGLEEQRKFDDRGRAVVNLDPSTGLCLDCTIAASKGARSFHSRRDDRAGDVIDPKARAARNDS